MLTLFSTVARSFLRAFLAAFVVYVGGVLAAPDLASARSLAIAGLLASLAAALRGIQVYLPQLTVAHWLGKPYGDWADSFLRAFLASLLVTVPKLLDVPHLTGIRQLAVAAIVGAAAAGVRAIQGFFTQGERPAPAAGLPEPPPSRATPPTETPAAVPPPTPATPAA